MLIDTTNRRLDTLGILSKQGKRINGLFRLMENPILWQQAYANIYANKGATTQGTDGSSLDGMSEQRITKLIENVKSGKYRFKPARRVLIPKDNGKTRPLGIPSGDDKLVQEVARLLLIKIYEPIFSNDSHGFRNGRSCHTALIQVKQKWTSIKWIVNMDIKGFFDNIDHEILIGILAKRIDDKRFLALIRSMLKAGYVENWKFHDSFSGTPQGGIISPILANIYLHELDEFVARMSAGFFKGKRRKGNSEYKRVSYLIEQCMKRIDTLKQNKNEKEIEKEMRELSRLRTERGKIPSSEPLDSNYRRLVYIRYADDFLIGVIGTREEAKSIMQDVTDYLKSELHLEIADEKSAVVHASDGVRFLGYDIRTYTGNRIVNTMRQGRYTTTKSVSERMQLHIPSEKLSKFCNKKGYGNYNTYQSVHRKFLTNLSEAEIVQTYNAEMRGIANYYSLAVNAKRDMNKLNSLWLSSLYKTLATKRRSTVTKVARSMKSNTGVRRLIVHSKQKYYELPIYDLKTLRNEPIMFQKVDYPPFTWHFTHSRSELIQRMEEKKCEYCGTATGSFEVHHIRKMADIAKGKQIWQIIMAQRQRKTLIMCVPCHKKLHSGKL